MADQVKTKLEADLEIRKEIRRMAQKASFVIVSFDHALKLCAQEFLVKFYPLSM